MNTPPALVHGLGLVRVWLRRRLQPPGGRERGSMSLFLTVAALCVFLVIGLVADGGAALNAAARADEVAQEAARAGGQQIDPDKAIPGEDVVVDPAAAARAARGYLAEEDVAGTVAVSGDGTTLTVTVRDAHETVFASLVGVPTLTVSGQGTARLIHRTGG